MGYLTDESRYNPIEGVIGGADFGFNTRFQQNGQFVTMMVTMGGVEVFRTQAPGVLNRDRLRAFEQRLHNEFGHHLARAIKPKDYL